MPKGYKKINTRIKLLRLKKGSLSGAGAKVEREVTVYEAQWPKKPHLYIFTKGRRVRVIITSGSFYGLPKGRYCRRAQRGER